MSLLDAIPGVRWAEAAVVAAVIGLMATAYLMQHNRIQALKLESAGKTVQLEKMQAAYAMAAASGATAAQTETARRVATQGDIANESQRFTTRALADAGDRRTADERLRGATAAVAARCSAGAPDPAAVAVSAPASAPGDLLADVQRRLGEAAGRVGEYADSAHGAGQQCQADYDALTPVSIGLTRLRLGG